MLFRSPNYNNIYNNFLTLDHNIESIEYIKNTIESYSTKEEVSQFITDKIIKKLIHSNIDAYNVYIVVGDSWNIDWADETIEV